ncbi:hypothetical protein KQX54_012107 [Cotesia glomerata]|uniref:Uncharacterized protein n=1 Tax=Cotesia glomerata TaxID=32391 RepID=A0AAV7J5Q9_COTGL|nr:hypothetical protein KQX54_012107 [Cotesia glomerata]
MKGEISQAIVYICSRICEDNEGLSVVKRARGADRPVWVDSIKRTGGAHGGNNARIRRHVLRGIEEGKGKSSYVLG